MAGTPSSSQSAAAVPTYVASTRVSGATEVTSFCHRRVVSPFDKPISAGFVFGFFSEDVEFFGADAEHVAQKSVAGAGVSAETDVEVFVDQAGGIADDDRTAVFGKVRDGDGYPRRTGRSRWAAR